MLTVHKAALQEIDVIVGNEAELNECETARIRGILFAALSEAAQADDQEGTP